MFVREKYETAMYINPYAVNITNTHLLSLDVTQSLTRIRTAPRDQGVALLTKTFQCSSSVVYVHVCMYVCINK